MNAQQRQTLNPALRKFLQLFVFCCEYTQTFGHLTTYVRGLLSAIPRKTVEPIALLGGTAPRTLQEFLRDNHWEYSEARDVLQRHTADVLPSIESSERLNTIGIIDETSDLKKGTKTPGVKRQYLGCVGKVDNGIVTVHLAVARAHYKALIDIDLFLPENWSDDRKRCRAAGIPDDVVYRPKWQIALEQLDRAEANGIVLDALTFDEGYGAIPGFIFGLDDREQLFVGEVPRIFSCLAVSRGGKRPDAAIKGRKAEDVVRTGSIFRGQKWQVIRLHRQTMQDQVWRIKSARVWLSSKDGWSEGSYWLIWASNDETGEEKFFLSNAAADANVQEMVRVAFTRWNVEHTFRIVKTELGFSHFEGQNYVALMRHKTLCLIAMGFVAEHTNRLRGEKCRDHRGAGVPSVR